MTLAHEAARHVRAHPAQADHSELHGRLSKLSGAIIAHGRVGGERGPSGGGGKHHTQRGGSPARRPPRPGACLAATPGRRRLRERGFSPRRTLARTGANTMNEQTLKATAAALTADARGLLAMDE
ncbi:MAG TPA: hypothetical protein VES00_07675, partial [Burkholderiaceae bacterium]|nr:hypothetical protein [Burkholderiaceae bacterium]